MKDLLTDGAGRSGVGNIGRGVPGGAEIVAPGDGGAHVDEVHSRSEVADVLRRLARDLGELVEAADIGEHLPST